MVMCRSLHPDRLAGQLGEQRIVDVVLFTANLLFPQDAHRRQCLQIARGRLAFGNAGIDQKPDLGVGLHKNQFDQILAVKGLGLTLHWLIPR